MSGGDNLRIISGRRISGKNLAELWKTVGKNPERISGVISGGVFGRITAEIL